MTNSMPFFKIILFLFFLIIYVLAFVIIKPFLLNYKRLLSTLVLKISYLLYLGILLICVYLFMFYGSSDIENQLSEILFFSLLICLFTPNLGILFRRSFTKYREHYNYFFTIINLFIAFFILIKLNHNSWFLH